MLIDNSFYCISISVLFFFSLICCSFVSCGLTQAWAVLPSAMLTCCCFWPALGNSVMPLTIKTQIIFANNVHSFPWISNGVAKKWRVVYWIKVDLLCWVGCWVHGLDFTGPVKNELAIIVDIWKLTDDFGMYSSGSLASSTLSLARISSLKSVMVHYRSAWALARFLLVSGESLSRMTEANRPP